MGKYKNLQDDVFTVFDSADWKALAIKAVPTNYLKVGSEEEFVRVNILPSGNGVNLTSVSGILLIDIFVSAGSGPLRISEIADSLDGFLVGKSLSTVGGNVTQFQNSSLQFEGKDKDNPTLARASYTVNFNFFGV